MSRRRDAAPELEETQLTFFSYFILCFCFLFISFIVYLCSWQWICVGISYRIALRTGSHNSRQQWMLKSFYAISKNGFTSCWLTNWVTDWMGWRCMVSFFLSSKRSFASLCCFAPMSFCYEQRNEIEIKIKLNLIFIVDVFVCAVEINRFNFNACVDFIFFIFWSFLIFDKIMSKYVLHNNIIPSFTS